MLNLFPSFSTVSSSKSIPVPEFSDYVEQIHKDSNKTFVLEYMVSCLQIFKYKLKTQTHNICIYKHTFNIEP